MPENAVPALQTLLKAILNSGLTWLEIGVDAGVHGDTARLWFYRPQSARGPSFNTVCKVAAAVGLEVQFVPAPRRIAADGYAVMDDTR